MGQLNVGISMIKQVAFTVEDSQGCFGLLDKQNSGQSLTSRLVDIWTRAAEVLSFSPI